MLHFEGVGGSYGAGGGDAANFTADAGVPRGEGGFFAFGSFVEGISGFCLWGRERGRFFKKIYATSPYELKFKQDKW